MFTTNRYQGDFYADGGILDSFPIGLTKNLTIRLDDTVLGMNLEYSPTPNQITDVVTYIFAIIKTMYSHINTVEWQIYADDIRYDLLRIYTDGSTAYELNLPPSTKRKLFEKGYQAAQAHFESADRIVHKLTVKMMQSVIKNASTWYKVYYTWL